MKPAEVVRLKMAASLRRERTDGKLARIALDDLDSGTGRLASGYQPDPVEVERCTRFAAGDVLFGKLRPYLAKTWRCQFDGCCSSEVLVFRAREGVLQSEYLGYIVQSEPFISWAIATSEGVKMPRTGWEALGEFRFALPDVAAQRRLVARLDREVGALDEAELELQRLIALLEERERVLITEAFEARAGSWRRTRLKFLLRARLSYGVLKPEWAGPDEEGISLVRVNNIAADGVQRDELARITRRQSLEYRRTVLRVGDLGVSVVGTLGKSFVVNEETAGCNTVRAVARVQPRPEADPHFLQLWTQSAGFAAQADEVTGTGTGQPTLNVGDLGNFELHVPDTPSEMKSFAAALAEDVVRCRAGRRELTLLAERLRERRLALITAAVLGKLDDQAPGAEAAA